jgi:predicted DNA-binding protein (MmcQ/YjbR family)
MPMTDTKTITIDDKEYVLEDLSEAARAQLVSLKITDQEIIRLQQQQNIAQTARNAYAQALNAELPKDA